MAYRYVYRRFVQRWVGINDTPESIALGTATGLFIGMTPTVGIQIVLILILNSLVRANRLAGVIMVNISNPLTLIPLYWLDYQLGAWLLGVERVSAERFEQVFQGFRSEASRTEWWSAFRELAVVNVEIYVPMLVGGVLLGLVLALPAYPLTLRFMRAHHRRRSHKHALLRLREIRRKERATARAALRPGNSGGEVESEAVRYDNREDGRRLPASERSVDEDEKRERTIR
ncbi:MAG: DUF2062 domain-containing protein [Planctomycetota bacterium]